MRLEVTEPQAGVPSGDVEFHLNVDTEAVEQTEDLLGKTTPKKVDTSAFAPNSSKSEVKPT